MNVLAIIGQSVIEPPGLPIQLRAQFLHLGGEPVEGLLRFRQPSGGRGDPDKPARLIRLSGWLVVEQAGLLFCHFASAADVRRDTRG